MINLDEIKNRADMILSDYAFTKEEGIVKILNLEDTTKAAVLNTDGEFLETTMSNTELKLVIQLYLKNKEFLEGTYAQILC